MDTDRRRNSWDFRTVTGTDGEQRFVAAPTYPDEHAANCRSPHHGHCPAGPTKYGDPTNIGGDTITEPKSDPVARAFRVAIDDAHAVTEPTEHPNPDYDPNTDGKPGTVALNGLYDPFGDDIDNP